jgi:hypothetical protein
VTTERAFPEGLIDYLAIRDAARETRRQALLSSLTPREAALVREAAVMGFVQGTMHSGAARVVIPKDSEILRRTVDGFLAFPDTYPNVTGYTEAEER